MTRSTPGAELSNYKLYSSGAMTTSGNLTVGATAGTGANKVNDFDTGWASKTAVWTDLNSPVTDAAGYINFPILDGNNIKLLTKDANGNTVPSYYGFDAYNNTTGAAGADGLPDVQGFSIDPSQVTYNPAQALSPSNTPVPMPVQWLYQLRDGTVIAADSSSTTTATFVNAAKQPSTSNPIVARIAFWTDDETSKVNINTAGEGTYWDTPHFYGKDSTPSTLTSPTGVVNSTLMSTNNIEMQYAFNQPAQFEFQRYPGHPAQVALSPILPKLAALSVMTGNAVTDAQNVANTMANVTPFLASGAAAGGSIGGTVRSGGAINLSMANRTAPYASIDELQFATSATTPRSVTKDVNNNALVSKPDLERARFFITASSRAPEVNLFGLPRISDWPIHTSLATNSTSPYTTSFDRLTAYCTTIGSNRYHFQRQKSNDTGFDYSGIPRNQQLYTYLQNLTSQPIPGFGGGTTGFLGKFGADRDQILTEIFDYIRTTDDFDVNLGPPPGDTMLPTLPWGSTLYQFANFQAYHAYSSYGQIAPIKIGTTKGVGRFPTLTEVAVMFICCADGTQPASSTVTLTTQQRAMLASNMSSPTNYPPVTLSNTDWTNQINNFITNNSPYTNVASYSNPAFNYPPNSTRNLGPTQKMYQMAFLFKTFCPVAGLYAIKPDLILQVSGNGKTLDQAVTINGATPANPFMAAPANFPTFYCVKLGAGQNAPGQNWGVQGNAGRANRYAVLLQALIESWRARWQQGNFPFFVVQLPNFNGGQGMVDMREAQAEAVQRVPAAGLVTTIDIGEPGNLHPPHKQEVGHRLALLALAKAYGQPIPSSGPVYQSLKVEGNSVRISFADADGLKSKDGGPLLGFEVAGSDHVYHAAQATIDGKDLVLSSPDVPQPLAARYDWAPSPKGNLYNQADLPAAPFRTDVLEAATP